MAISVNITTRLDQVEALTFEEADANFVALKNAVESAAEASQTVSTDGYLQASGTLGGGVTVSASASTIASLALADSAIQTADLDPLLPRDGSRVMTGDLDMGNNVITNADNFVASDTGTLMSFYGNSTVNGVTVNEIVAIKKDGSEVYLGQAAAGGNPPIVQVGLVDGDDCIKVHNRSLQLFNEAGDEEYVRITARDDDADFSKPGAIAHAGELFVGWNGPVNSYGNIGYGKTTPGQSGFFLHWLSGFESWAPPLSLQVSNFSDAEIYNQVTDGSIDIHTLGAGSKIRLSAGSRDPENTLEIGNDYLRFGGTDFNNGDPTGTDPFFGVNNTGQVVMGNQLELTGDSAQVLIGDENTTASTLRFLSDTSYSNAFYTLTGEDNLFVYTTGARVYANPGTSIKFESSTIPSPSTTFFDASADDGVWASQFSVGGTGPAASDTAFYVNDDRNAGFRGDAALSATDPSRITLDDYQLQHYGTEVNNYVVGDDASLQEARHGSLAVYYDPPERHQDALWFLPYRETGASQGASDQAANSFLIQRWDSQSTDRGAIGFGLGAPLAGAHAGGTSGIKFGRHDEWRVLIDENLGLEVGEWTKAADASSLPTWAPSVSLPPAATAVFRQGIELANDQTITYAAPGSSGADLVIGGAEVGIYSGGTTSHILIGGGTNPTSSGANLALAGPSSTDLEGGDSSLQLRDATDLLLTHRRGTDRFEVHKPVQFAGGIVNEQGDVIDAIEEMGTWTPEFVPETGSWGTPAPTYAYQDGTYVRWGSMVWVSFHIQAQAIYQGTADGYLKLGGLPFAEYNEGAFAAITPILAAASNAGSWHDSNQDNSWLAPHAVEVVNAEGYFRNNTSWARVRVSDYLNSMTPRIEGSGYYRCAL